MKKILLTALIASMLIVPLGNTALAGHEEADPVSGFQPGDVPAEISTTEAMLPAVHGMVLAMLNHGASSFDPADRVLAWEGLYNMLALYGQLDGRCDMRSGAMQLPEETVWDYAAALNLQVDRLGALPGSLNDRIREDSGSYFLVCGDEGLTQLQMDTLRPEGSGLLLTGTLNDPGEGDELARFQALLQPRDNMFGFAIIALTIE